MKKTMFVLPLSLMLAGCFSTPAPQIADWTIEYSGASGGAGGQAKSGVCRLLHVSVRAPYDTRNIAVMRGDGSLAFDPYNRFSASPSALLRSVAMDALRASGVFRTVVPVSSSVRTDTSLEADFTRVALDCRDGDHLKAVVELTLSLVERREFVKTVKAKGEAFVVGGDYSRAFSAAASTAVEDCSLELLK